MNLNLNNAEELIFHDKGVQKLLPEFQDLFNQWRFAFVTPGFKSLGKKSVMDLLNGLTPEHVEILEKHFKSKVTISKMDYHVIRNCEFKLAEVESGLENIEGFPYFCMSRDKDQVYISFWR